MLNASHSPFQAEHGVETKPRWTWTQVHSSPALIQIGNGEVQPDFFAEAALPSEGGRPVQKEKNNEDAPRAQFAETEHRFGIATLGEKIEHDFRLSNVGKKPLIVSVVGAT